jgi:methionine synthase II (cobalamin-independent)
MEAREKRQNGEIEAAQLQEVEDRCIRDAVKMQEDAGMQGITDGEFRRTLWHADFLSRFEGIKVVEGLSPESARHFQNPDADVQRSPTQFAPAARESTGPLTPTWTCSSPIWRGFTARRLPGLVPPAAGICKSMT